MTITIRPVRPDDHAQWLVLWKGYQDFYQTNLDAVTANTWERLLAGDPDGPFCLVAEENEKLLGLTHYLFHATTWSPKQRIYLNDLYTLHDARGKGVGGKLIEAVYAVADERDCETVYWLTEDNNTAGRRLYDKVARLTPFIKYTR